MSAVQRMKELHRTRSRKSKLRLLRSHYQKATSEQVKENILQKVKRIALWLSVEEFLAPLDKK